MTEYIERDAVLSKFDYDEYYHYNEIRDVLRDIPAADVAPVRHGRWIPVTERLPERGEVGDFCLICATGTLGNITYENAVAEADFDGYRWYDSAGRCMNDIVTHWMPMPKPPEKGEPK